MIQLLESKRFISHDVRSGSDIMPCIKIDKPLLVYRCSNIVNDVHYNVA